MSENFTLNQLRIFRFSLGVVMLAQGMVFSTFASRISDIKSSLELTNTWLGLMLFALPLGMFTSIPLTGYLTNKFGSKKMIFVAACMYTFMLLMLAYVSNEITLFAALFLYGSAANFITISANTNGVSVETLYKRSILGTFHGIWSLGGFLGVIFAHFFAPHLSIQAHFAIVAATALGIMILVWCKLVNKDYSAKSHEDATKTKSMFRPSLFVFTLGILAFSSMFTESAMHDWSVVYFSDTLQITPEYQRLGLMIYLGNMMLGRFLSDTFVTLFGIIRVLRANAVLIFVGIFLVIISPDIVLACIGLAFVGFGVSSVVPLCFSAAGKSFRMKPSVAISSITLIGYMAFLLSPLVIGGIAKFYTLRVSFVVIALLAIVLFVLPKRLHDRVS